MGRGSLMSCVSVRGFAVPLGGAFFLTFLQRLKHAPIIGKRCNMSVSVADDPISLTPQRVRTVVIFITKIIRPERNMVLWRMAPKVDRIEWGVYCTKCLSKHPQHFNVFAAEYLCCDNITKPEPQKCIEIDVSAFCTIDEWPPRKRNISESTIHAAIRHYYDESGTPRQMPGRGMSK